MKTNISIELSDEQRNAIARQLYDKDTKRLVTRAEVVAIATDAVLRFIDQPRLPPVELRVVDDLPCAVAPTPPPKAGPLRAVVEPAADIPCENPSTEKDFPAMVADWYTRAKQNDENLHSHIIWDAEKRGIKVKS